MQIGNEYADAFQISSRDTIEIKPILGSNGHALLLSLRYKSNWKPRFQSFKIYRGPESVSAVSYNIEMRDDKGTVLYATTLSHDTKENDSGGEVNWKEQEIVFCTEAYECTLHIRPNYDTKSLRESGLDGAALTIMLHIKLAGGVRWRDRHSAQNLRAPLSSARGVVISRT